MTDELEKDGTKLYHPEIEVIKDGATLLKFLK